MRIKGEESYCFEIGVRMRQKCVFVVNEEISVKIKL